MFIGMLVVYRILFLLSAAKNNQKTSNPTNACPFLFCQGFSMKILD